MQHIHLELLWILNYAITKKNNHISKINIFDNYKIVINSRDVHLAFQDNMQKLDTKSNYCYLQKSFGQVMHKWKTIHIKIFTT
jgi:hypothetical protein